MNAGVDQILEKIDRANTFILLKNSGCAEAKQKSFQEPASHSRPDDNRHPMVRSYVLCNTPTLGRCWLNRDCPRRAMQLCKKVASPSYRWYYSR